MGVRKGPCTVQGLVALRGAGCAGFSGLCMALRVGVFGGKAKAQTFKAYPLIQGYALNRIKDPVTIKKIFRNSEGYWKVWEAP